MRPGCICLQSNGTFGAINAPKRYALSGARVESVPDNRLLPITRIWPDSIGIERIRTKTM